jgi:hypothetical protein
MHLTTMAAEPKKTSFPIFKYNPQALPLRPEIQTIYILNTFYGQYR